MLAKLKTYSLVGIDAVPVDVEVDLSPAALPKTVLVGLPEQAVRESTHRVERALVNAGFLRPQDRIVINLAPACCLLESRLWGRQPAGKSQLFPRRI
jgi:magnesium chelatase family protein